MRRALTALIAAGAIASSATARTATSSHIFAPFNGGRIAAGVHVSREARGYCWTGSISDFARSDAWRCFLGNEILDPCFSNDQRVSGFVLCAYSPWSSVIELRLTRALPRRMGNRRTSNPTAKRPWAILLGSGARCVAVSGATGSIAGLGLDYSCTPHGLLAGAPHRTTATWTIFYAQSYSAKSLTRRAIKAAWW